MLSTGLMAKTGFHVVSIMVCQGLAMRQLQNYRAPGPDVDAVWIQSAWQESLLTTRFLWFAPHTRYDLPHCPVYVKVSDCNGQVKIVMVK